VVQSDSSLGSSSFALKLQTPEAARSEGTETEGDSGRLHFFSLKAISSKQLQKCFSGTHILCLLVGKTP
jgi:hypothetical protein